MSRVDDAASVAGGAGDDRDELLRAVLDGLLTVAPLSALAFDADGRCTAKVGDTTLLPEPEATLLGRPVTHLLPAVAPVTELVDDARAGRRTSARIAAERGTFDLSALPGPGGSGLLVITDVTAELAAQRDLTQKVALAERSDALSRGLMQRFLTAQLQEQADISSSIHADAIQVLAASRHRLDAIARAVEDPSLGADLERVSDALQEAATATTASLLSLGGTWQEGFETAVHSLAEMTLEPVGITHTIELDDVARVDEPIKGALYRILADALDVLRSARAGTVRVRVVHADGQVELAVEADGVALEDGPVEDLELTSHARASSMGGGASLTTADQHLRLVARVPAAALEPLPLTGVVQVDARLVTDIAEQARGARQLADAVFDECGAAIVLVDRYDRVLRLNPAAADLTGRPADAIVGQPFGAAYGVARPIVQLYRSVDPWESVVAQPGGHRIVRWSCRRVEIDRSEVFVVAGLDVTAEHERLGAQASLASALAWREAVLDHLAPAFLVVGPTGTVAYASPALTRATGLEADELVGRSWLEAVGPASRARATALLSAAVASGSPGTATLELHHATGADAGSEVAIVDLQGVPAVGGLLVVLRNPPDGPFDLRKPH